MATKKTASDWRYGSKRNQIARCAEQGMSKRETFETLRPSVMSGTMIFSANVGGRRIAKPVSEQLIMLKNEIGRVYKLLGRATSADFTSEEIDIPAEEIFSEEIETEDEEIEDEDEEISSEPETPIAKGKERIRTELGKFLSEVRRIRKVCEDRAATGASLDWISMRPVQAASKLIPAGIPASALLHAMTLHWKDDIRREVGIPDFDFVSLSKSIMLEREIPTEGKHELFGYVLTLAENRQPVMLIGPAGTGKSHIAKQISEYLELQYGETPMTSGATRGDLLGRMTANPDQPFVLSEFVERYSNGGVFNFEEIDAADPGMLIVLNNALAQNELFNASNGLRYSKHPDFVPMCTANTFGIGANKDYTGRERLDAATIDRWRMGRILIPLDETIETEMLYGRL